MKNCESCNQQTEESNLCGDNFCRECHVSISFDDCTRKILNAQLMLNSGHEISYVQKIWPQSFDENGELYQNER